MDSRKDYHKAYRTKINAEERTICINFNKKDISKEDIYNIYSDKINNKTQEKLLNNIIDLIDLIEAHKRSLEELGVSNRTVTGTIKVNPSEKSLRECMLQLSKLIKDLDENIANTSINKKDSWIDELINV